MFVPSDCRPPTSVWKSAGVRWWGASGFNPYVRFLPDSRRSGLGAMMSASGPGRRSTCKMST